MVKNERRQSYENRPYGLVYETILAAHVSAGPSLQLADDRLDGRPGRGQSREDVADFFRRYYHPANASLCIAGDFDPAEAKRLVEKYFGPIPPGPKVEKMQAAAGRAEGARSGFTMTDRVGLPRLYMVWPTVPMFAADDAGAGHPGRRAGAAARPRGCTRSLVREKQIAQDVSGVAEFAGDRRRDS